MKKAITIILIAAFTMVAVDLAIMGMKIFDKDYDIFAECYVGLVCFASITACGIVRLVGALRNGKNGGRR